MIVIATDGALLFLTDDVRALFDQPTLHLIIIEDVDPFGGFSRVTSAAAAGGISEVEEFAEGEGIG